MKLRSIALAIGLTLSTVGFAHAALPDAAPQSVSTNYSGATTLLDGWSSAWTSIFNANFGSDWSKFIYNGPIAGGVFSVAIGNIAATTTAYSQAFTWDSLTGVATFSMPVAVPGPEAGAGLGALGLGGIAYLVARRRKSATTA